jgi:hypothetical protein
MAELYCLEHGLIPIEKAEEIYERIQREKKKPKK